MPRMCPEEAPMARIMPISLVRSITLIHNEPISPMPPTSATITASTSSMMITIAKGGIGGLTQGRHGFALGDADVIWL